MESSLGLSGSGLTNIADSSGTVNESISITAFDCDTAPVNFIYLITSNTYSANLSVSSSAYSSGTPGSLVLVTNSIGDVQISSVLGASLADSAAASNGGATGFVITPTANASSGIGGPMPQVNGEVVNFTLSATLGADVLALGAPSSQVYGTLPTVDVSLRRDTVFDVYELVPEPSSTVFLVLGCGFLLRRRRA